MVATISSDGAGSIRAQASPISDAKIKRERIAAPAAALPSRLRLPGCRSGAPGPISAR